MALEKKSNLEEAREMLEKALAVYGHDEKLDNKLQFLLITKAFEVLIEYGWKELKRRVEDEGLDAPSPKAAIRAAARLSMISEPEVWIRCLNARNDSVHNYYALPEKDFTMLCYELLKAAAEIVPPKVR